MVRQVRPTQKQRLENRIRNLRGWLAHLHLAARNGAEQQYITSTIQEILEEDEQNARSHSGR